MTDRPLQPIARRELLMRLLHTVGASSVLACGEERFTCADTAGLSPDDLAGRSAVAYVEPSPDPTRLCSDCTQFEPAPKGCGGCKVVKGRIHPSGTCKVFAKAG